MTTLPAHCPNCRSIFPFHGIALGDGASVELINVSTNCPVCGFHDAIVNDGIYKATKGVVEVLSGSETTKARLQALKEIAERLRDGKITTNEATQQAAVISPRYASLIQIIEKIGLPGATLLLTIIGVYLQYAQMNSSSSAEDNQRIVEAITRQTIVIQDVLKQQHIQDKSKIPTSGETKSKTPTLKSKKKRRAQVREKRRERLQSRRDEFGGARYH